MALENVPILLLLNKLDLKESDPNFKDEKSILEILNLEILQNREIII